MQQPDQTGALVARGKEVVVPLHANERVVSQAKSRIGAIVAAQVHMSQDEAGKRFDNALAKLKQARDQAVQSAKNAADAIAGRRALR